MRIVVVNVNTTESMTESIRAQAAKAAAPGTEIVAVTPFFGPAAVEGYFDSHLSAVAVMDRIAAITEPYDAVIEAGFGENAQPGLQEIVSVPVLSITEAAAHLACLVGYRFAVVTTVPRAIRQIRERLQVAGLLERCVSIRSTDVGVLEIERDPDAAIEAIIASARTAVAVDGADAICLGCAGMADLQERVAEVLDVPVIDGVSAAVKLAESLHALGLGPSGEVAGGSRSPITGWPLHQSMGLGPSNPSD